MKFWNRSNVRERGWLRRIAIKRTTFRTKPYALCFGGAGGRGTNYEWMGIAVRIFVR